MTEGEHSHGQVAVAGLHAAVMARYGTRFSPQDVETLRRQIAELVDAAEILRGVPLLNGDEPDLNFQARRGDG